MLFTSFGAPSALTHRLVHFVRGVAEIVFNDPCYILRWRQSKKQVTASPPVEGVPRYEMEFDAGDGFFRFRR
jgi:hypothetical protein